MAKYVKCIQSDLGVPLTEGNCYKIIDSDFVSYFIEGDDGYLEWWNKYRFEEPYELPESITFASQEDFENAVMKVVLKRLGVCIDTKATPYGNSKAYLPLEDLA